MFFVYLVDLGSWILVGYVADNFFDFVDLKTFPVIFVELALARTYLMTAEDEYIPSHRKDTPEYVYNKDERGT